MEVVWCAQAFSRKNSLSFLQVSKSAKGFLTDVNGNNSADLNFHTQIMRKGFFITYTLMLLQMITTRKGFVTHITQKKGGNQCAHSNAASGYCEY
jgi:hypothetical protein